MNSPKRFDSASNHRSDQPSDRFISVFNDVLGPVMRGPSSSHTAGSFHIGRVARNLLGEPPADVDISFDSNGSYAGTYVQQGADQAFATGLMGWQLTDKHFLNALTMAAEQGAAFRFRIDTLPRAEHPNHVVVRLRGASGARLSVEAASTGGGAFVVTRIDDQPVCLDGKHHVLVVGCRHADAPVLSDTVGQACRTARITSGADASDGGVLITAASPDTFPAGLIDQLLRNPKAAAVRRTEPVYFVQRGRAPFASAAEMLDWADSHSCSLGEAVLHYETAVLGISPQTALAEMARRYEIMKQSASDGFKDENADMLLLDPTAGTIRRRIVERRVPIGGTHAEAAAAALAVMHTSNSRGIVCAAPTGGAAGTLPGTLFALEKDFDIPPRLMAAMLFAAGGIGLVLAIRGTFAAEVAGCQVEIGAAGAMAAAAVVEFAGGSAGQACDAAAVSFQNSMGSVCDPVQGICEIPCHSRNAAAASNALTIADLVLGGYQNPIPLDETVDAVYACGRLLPSQLRCTARGGLASAPSAQKLARRR